MKDFADLTVSEIESLKKERAKALSLQIDSQTISQLQSFYNTKKEIQGPRESSNNNKQVLLG